MKYLRRLVWFVATRIFILTCILGICTVAFYFSMNASNIYVVLKDGMAKRAQTIMMAQDTGELAKYFSDACLARDAVLLTTQNGTNPYLHYNIKGIDHRLKMEWMWCWPWDDVAKATVVEKIPAVDGRVKAQYKTGKEEQDQIPPWQSGRYDVLLTREDGQWRIKTFVFRQAVQ